MALGNAAEAVPSAPDRTGTAPRRAPRKGLPQCALTRNWGRVPALAQRQLNLFISLEAKVLRGDNPDAIHDLRVSSRRLQTTLDLLYPKPRPQKIRKLRRTIRRSRRALSVVRNYDVLFERVEKARARKRLSRRAVWESFREYLQERRLASFRKATRKLGTLNLPDFFLRLKSQLGAATAPSTGSAPGGDGTPAAAPRVDSIPDRVLRALEQTWMALDGCLLQAQAQPAAAALHAVRIAAKRLRYFIEVLQELGVAGSQQALDCLRQMQQQLGDWHDMEIMEQAMLEMVARPQFLRNRLELALQTERQVLRNRRTKKRYEEAFFAMVRHSPDWDRLERWVRSALAPPPPSVAGQA